MISGNPQPIIIELADGEDYDFRWIAGEIYRNNANESAIILKILSNGAIAGIVGIVFAHIIADFIAALADPDLKSAAYGIVIGGFLPLLAVPFLEKYVTKSKYHTVVGDHEDLKKDLKRKHI